MHFSRTDRTTVQMEKWCIMKVELQYKLSHRTKSNEKRINRQNSMSLWLKADWKSSENCSLKLTF